MTDEIIETPVENVENVPEPVPTDNIPVAEKEAESPTPAELTQPEPTLNEPEVVNQEVQIEQVGNKTIEKKGDTVTITEVMQPTPAQPVAFPAPFRQNDLWQKFLNKLSERKSKKLERVMKAFEKTGKLTNDEVEKLLHVSDATATRYLDQLEKEGRIRQVGKTGKYTYYEKI
jgi:predicted HTH transcriptional regulator